MHSDGFFYHNLVSGLDGWVTMERLEMIGVPLGPETNDRWHTKTADQAISPVN